MLFVALPHYSAVYLEEEARGTDRMINVSMVHRSFSKSLNGRVADKKSTGWVVERDLPGVPACFQHFRLAEALQLLHQEAYYDPGPLKGYSYICRDCTAHTCREIADSREESRLSQEALAAGLKVLKEDFWGCSCYRN